MTKEVTTTLNGKSGTIYGFKLSPWECLFQHFGAVYTVLCKNYKIKTYTVLYIGITSDLNTHFDDHRKRACLDYYGKTHIGIHFEPDSQIRALKVADLIANYRPVCNS